MSSRTEQLGLQIKELEAKRECAVDKVKQAKEEESACDAQLWQLRDEKKAVDEAAAIQKAKQRFLKFKGTKSKAEKDIIYQEALDAFKEGLGFTLREFTPGSVSDSIVIGNRGGFKRMFKINRKTGDLYGSAKHPKGNIIGNSVQQLIERLER